MGWDVAFDARCEHLAASVVQGDVGAWQELIVRISGPIEAWAARHPTLRRWRLDGPDDRRAVLVRVLERLAARRHQALADYVDRRGLRPEPGELARLPRLDEVDDEDLPATPFAAWLRAVFRYALLDHVHHRLGWRDGAGRRSVGSDAERIGDHEPSARPALTDALAVAERMAAVNAALDALPAEMAAAVRRWAEGEDFGEVAVALGLPDAAAARRLVRAGHARLRDALRRVSED